MTLRRFKLKHEMKLWKKGITRIAGVDEVGRGPLAGPVVAAAVVFSPKDFIKGVDDSKKLSPEERLELYPLILERCVCYGVGIVSVAEIDRINIYQASLVAMRRAIVDLAPAPEHLIIDGRCRLDLNLPQTAIVKGDALSFTIGAASIVAKVVRDLIMVHYHKQFPNYGFDVHKGYATPKHLECLKKFGPCAIHRRSFHPRAIEPDLFRDLEESKGILVEPTSEEIGLLR